MIGIIGTILTKLSIFFLSADASFSRTPKKKAGFECTEEL